MTSRKFPMLGGIMGKDIGSGGGSLPPLVINVASDFPTVAQANEDMGRTYVIGTNVTDNDPTKTNTGQSFLAGDEIIWNGTLYVALGHAAIFIDDGTDVKTVNDPRNFDLQGGGLKDDNVTTAVNLGDGSNTSCDTTNKTLIGAINEINAKPSGVSTTMNSSNTTDPNYFAGMQITAPGQTAFTISQAPASNEAFQLYLNGVLLPKTEYSLSGTNLTYSGVALSVPSAPGQPDELTAIINYVAGATSVTSFNARTGAVLPASGDYDVSEVTNAVSTSTLNAHTGAANPHSGSAANGANSDINSLSGLTTPLSIAQGGTNSGAALTNGKVMQSSGGAISESTVNITNLTQKEVFFAGTGYNANLGNFRTREVGGTGAHNFTFCVPSDFASLVSCEVVGIISTGAAGAAKDIDLSSDYGAVGEAYNIHSETDTTTTYDFTGKANQLASYSIAPVLSALSAGDYVGFDIDHNGIGGAIDYIGIKLVYNI